MALSKKIVLSNGVELNYFKINNIEVSLDNIKIHLDAFINKEVYNLSSKKKDMIEDQSKLVEEFKKLDEKEKLTKKQEERKTELFNKVNDLADIIDKEKDYDKYVIVNTEYILPYIDDFSEVSLEKELLKTPRFASAKIIK